MDILLFNLSEQILTELMEFIIVIIIIIIIINMIIIYFFFHQCLAVVCVYL
jgi:hypothetical protein